MDDEDKWSLVHEYRNASVNGLVPAILCPDCEDELVTTANLDGNPALRCLSCVVVHSISLPVYEQMIDNLEELEGL